MALMRRHTETGFDCDVKHEVRLNKRLIRRFPHTLVFDHDPLSLLREK